MRKTLISVLMFSVVLSVSARAQLFTNLVQDPSFEAISGNQPNTDTTPWVAVEAQDGSIVTDTSIANSGDQSVRLSFYFDQSAIYQDLGHQLQPHAYQLSFWMRYGDPSGNANHVNTPSVNVNLRVADEIDGSYTYIPALAAFGLVPDSVDTWQQFTVTFPASTIENYEGQYARIWIRKADENTTHRIWIDDVELMAIPEPMTVGMLLLGALSLLPLRRRLHAD